MDTDPPIVLNYIESTTDFTDPGSFQPATCPSPVEPSPVPVTGVGSLRRSPRLLGSVDKGNAAESSSLRRSSSNSSFSNSSSSSSKRIKLSSECTEMEVMEREQENGSETCFFLGDPVPEQEARERWSHHYAEKGKRSCGRPLNKSDEDEDEIILAVKFHYSQASVCGSILTIGDCAYVKGPPGKPNYIGRLLEFFETTGGEKYFTVQWFYRAEDTVIGDQASFHDKKRLFYSDLKNDNLLDCIVSKVRIAQVPPGVEDKSKLIPSSYFYYDMKYSIDYTTFSTMQTHDSGEKIDLPTTVSSGTENSNDTMKNKPNKNNKNKKSERELSLLDLYCGCGGMSTGLCLGAHIAGVNLVTKWAIDYDAVACQSLKLNHPETQVRNERADDFLDLLKAWDKLCKQYANFNHPDNKKELRVDSDARTESSRKLDRKNGLSLGDEEYEVWKLVDICYGDPNNVGERKLMFKVRWKGYTHNDDTWEPLEGLSNCKEAIRVFVKDGLKSKILPLPGEVDVVCGGPPCQGISGYNRFRNFEAPLEDERNRQIIVFMDIVQFLRPRYVLMENVVDILKFARGTLARYALSRLVHMSYQVRLGIMAAGSYGLPQFRLRVFLMGSHHNEKLPQFPLPTHEVILKYGSPTEFERNLVGYDEGKPRQLAEALVLQDILSDLPAVTNNESRDEMPYWKDPQTKFQRYVRTPKFEMLGLRPNGATTTKPKLYDHRPLPLCEDNYLRVCQIPKRKGANFRDLPGVIVGPDNIAKLDPKMERIFLPSGSPLVPNCAMTFEEGKSVRPFARLWWDEVVATVLTVPNSRSQAIIHPEQDRILTIRESARLQGFPDYYRFHGSVKDRYRQIGNAVAIPVGRALGFALARAWLNRNGENGDEPLITLPPNFSFSLQIHNHCTTDTTTTTTTTNTNTNEIKKDPSASIPEPEEYNSSLSTNPITSQPKEYNSSLSTNPII